MTIQERKTFKLIAKHCCLTDNGENHFMEFVDTNMFNGISMQKDTFLYCVEITNKQVQLINYYMNYLLNCKPYYNFNLN